METNINIYECVKSSKVKKSITWTEVMNEIKFGYNYGELVEKAREIGKGNSGFDKLKTTKISTYTVNATFNEKRHGDNIISPTGLLYLDIDDCLDLNLDNHFIHAAYKSVSGTGMCVIVKTKNLDKKNIKSLYSFLQENIRAPLDYKSADMTRQTVFSYDPNIYINENSIELDANEIVEVYNEKRDSKPILYKKIERSTGLLYSTPVEPFNLNRTEFGLEVRWDNTNEFEFDGFYQMFDKPVDIIKVYIPRTIQEGNRYFAISAILNNYLFLNPWLDNYRIKGFLDNINSRCEKPLLKEELNRIYHSKTQALRLGDLEPIYNAKRSVVYSKACPKELQRKVNGIISGKRRTENSYRKILNSFEDWNYNEPKPTNLIFAKNAEISIGTFKKYIRIYSELKELREIVKKCY